MVIGACGFGSTGSSAVSDYLSEYDSIQTIDRLEFGLVSGMDGLVDLGQAVMHPHNRSFDSVLAIDRYIAKTKRIGDYYEHLGFAKAEFEKSVDKFIEAITQCKWYGYDNDKNYSCKPVRYLQKNLLMQKLIPRIEKRRGDRIICYPMKQCRLSVCPPDFYTAARTHISEVLKGLGADDSKITVLDQPFAGNNPQACFPFFEDPYAIVVDRDPRDNYVFARTRLLGKNHFMPVDNVGDFIAYYRAIRKDQPYTRTDKRILVLRFEDMVYDYDHATEKIRLFLKLPPNPNPKSIFDPAVSLPNTQVYKRFPEFSEDIRVIERELPEYLFDFDKYGCVDTSGNMFFGKSPLNKKRRS